MIQTNKSTNKTIRIIFVVLLCSLLIGACQTESTIEDKFETENSTSHVASSPLPPQTISTPTLASLEITSNLPNALVYINGNQVGQTPYSSYWPTDTYNITVSLAGFHPWNQQINLTEPRELRVDFSFAPRLEQILDIAIDQFWWAENGNAIYYVKCTDTGCNDNKQYEYNSVPIWKLNLVTQESTQATNIWPPTWIPPQYAHLIQETVPNKFIHVSPSGQIVLYFDSINSESPMALSIFDDPPIFNIYIIVEGGIIEELGSLSGLPSTNISWSEDEQIILIPTERMMPGTYGGWIANLGNNTIYPLTSPIPNESRINLDGATILPNGHTILFRPHPTLNNNSFYLWNFQENNSPLLPVRFGASTWFENNHYMFANNKEGLFWYDLVNDHAELIISELPGIPRISILSPEKDKVLLQFDASGVSGGKILGLWLLTVDTES